MENAYEKDIGKQKNKTCGRHACKDSRRDNRRNDDDGSGSCGCSCKCSCGRGHNGVARGERRKVLV